MEAQEMTQKLAGMGIRQLEELHKYIEQLIEQVEKAREQYSKEIEIVSRIARQCGAIEKEADEKIEALREQIKNIEAERDKKIDKLTQNEEFQQACDKLAELPRDVLEKLLGQDDAEFVRSFIEGEEPQYESKASEGLASRVYQFLAKNKGRKYSSSELAEQFGMKAAELGHKIYYLLRSGKIKKEKINGRLVYWVE